MDDLEIKFAEMLDKLKIRWEYETYFILPDLGLTIDAKEQSVFDDYSEAYFIELLDYLTPLRDK